MIVAQRLRKGACRVTTRREAAGRRRGEDHPTTARQDPAGPGADGLGVLRPRTSPRRPGRRRRGVGHRADGPGGQGGDRHDRRRRVDHDRVHRRRLRRGHRPLDLPGRGRRDRLHRVRRAEEGRPGARAGSWCAGSRTSTPRRTRQPARTPCSTCGGSTRSSPPPTPSVLDTVAADKTHRGHAVIEQVHADLKNSALAHLPSGVFTANAAWLVLAVIAFNLTRAAASLDRPQTWPRRPPRPSAAS